MLVYNPTDPNPPTKRIEWLRTLLSASLPLTLFIDDMFRRALEGAGWFSEANHPELQLIDWSLEESDVWKKCESVSLRLPEIRNEEKDGAFFLKLMNAKAELVARVAEGGSERFVGFLDAGIVKIFKDVEGSLRRLKELRIREVDGVILPGCWSPGVVAPEALVRKISWIFCGGFFVMKREEAKRFSRAAAEAFHDLVKRGWLTWEVNVWVHMQTLSNVPTLLWFEADHNDRMTMVPEKWREI
ncbi:hypothetical protein EBR66_05995 [bacterium]|nr:hypothetical protein [bacterium]